MTSKTAKLIKEELLDLEKNKLENVVFESTEDLFHLVCNMIAPPYSMYAGENLKLNFTFTEFYPTLSPIVVFIPPNIPRHDYIDENGKVDLTTFYHKYELRKICSRILEMMRSVRINYFLQWKIKEPIPERIVDFPFEVQNGLVGMGRFVIVRLLALITTRNAGSEKEMRLSIRSMVGICQEHTDLKNHPCFLASRHFIQIRISVIGRMCIPVLTIRPTDTIGAVKRRLLEMEGEKDTRGIFPPKQTSPSLSPEPKSRRKKKGNEKRKEKEKREKEESLKHALYLEDVLLEDSRPCYYYKIGDKDRTFLAVQSTPPADPAKGELRVILRTMVGRSYVFVVRETERLTRLAGPVSETIGVSMEGLRLVFNGRVMAQTSVSFQYYGLRNNSVVFQVIPLRG